MNDIDEQVAREVMGWRPCAGAWAEEDSQVFTAGSDWSPSTRIDHAWMVVEKMGECLFSGRQRFTLALYENMPRLSDGRQRHWSELIWNLTPEDICRAALAAVRAHKEAKT